MQAVRLNDLLNTLTSVKSKMRIILLDVCRNNPFPEINKTIGRGLSIVDAKVGTAAASGDQSVNSASSFMSTRGGYIAPRHDLAYTFATLARVQAPIDFDFSSFPRQIVVLND